MKFEYLEKISSNLSVFIDKRYRIIVALLLAVFFLQCTLSIRQKATTFDEIGHIAAGYAFLKYDDYRLYDIDPPLIRQLCAIPLLFMDLNFPLQSHAWEKKMAIDLGREFLYEMNGRKADKILFWSRIPAVLLATLFGFVLFKFASDLFGKASGVFALTLFTFQPNILAHSRLATTDVGLSLFIVLTVYFLYKYWHNHSWKLIIATGISLGLAVCSKSSGIILLPVTFFMLVLVFPLVARHQSKQWFKIEYNYFFSKDLAKAFGRWIVVSLVGLFVLCMDYGFFNTWPIFIEPDDAKKFELSIEKLGVTNPETQEKVAGLAAKIGVPARPFFVSLVKWFGFLPRLESEGKVGGYKAYLNGERGRFFKFPFYAFFLKEPIPIILLFGLGIVVLALKSTRRFLFLMLPILFIFAMTFRVHTWAYRYINLPIMPFMILIISGIICYTFRNKIHQYAVQLGVAVLSLWMIISSIAIYPHYLPYFNELAGGPSSGHKYMVNSNFDWGQDLKYLERYVEDNGVEKIYLSYFGSADVNYYKIPYQEMLGVDGRESRVFTHEEATKLSEPRNGLIAISVTCLQNIKGFFPNFSYDWLKSHKPIAKLGYTIFIYDIKDFNDVSMQ